MAQAPGWSPRTSLPPSYTSIDRNPPSNYPESTDSPQTFEDVTRVDVRGPRAQYLYYCIFQSGLSLRSREALDTGDDFVGRIPRAEIPRPRTYEALKRCIASREGFDVEDVLSIYLEGSEEALVESELIQLQEGSSGTTFSTPFDVFFDPIARRQPIPGGSEDVNSPSSGLMSTPARATPSPLSTSSASDSTIYERRRPIGAGITPPLGTHSSSASLTAARPASSQTVSEFTNGPIPPSYTEISALPLLDRLPAGQLLFAPLPAIRIPPAPIQTLYVRRPPPHVPTAWDDDPPSTNTPTDPSRSQPEIPPQVTRPSRSLRRDGQGRRVRSEPAWRIRSDWVGEPTLSLTEPGKVISDLKPPGWFYARIEVADKRLWKNTVTLRSGTVLRNGVEIYVDTSRWSRSRWVERNGEKICRVIVKHTREISELLGNHYHRYSDDSSI